MVKGFATALGMQSLLIDWGLHYTCEVASDSSAAMCRGEDWAKPDISRLDTCGFRNELEKDMLR